jgi:hypothetical protein
MTDAKQVIARQLTHSGEIFFADRRGVFRGKRERVQRRLGHRAPGLFPGPVQLLV